MPVMGVFFGAEPRQKVPQQMRDIFAAHPQGRNRQQQHVEAIEQIFAELSADAIEQLGGWSRNDADFDFHRLAPADGLDGAFLQRAKQFHLRGQRNSLTSSRKQRSTASLDEFAGMGVGGTGKAPFSWPNRIDSRDCRDRAAIDGNERF